MNKVGTDIHLIIEKQDDSGVWKTLRGSNKIIEEFEADDRDYALFARVADIRNGYGFAGVKIFDPYVPLFPNRGLPDDFKLKKGDWLGDHGFTWMYLFEILDADWTITNKNHCLVDRDQYDQLKQDGYPKTYCADAWGHGIKKTEDSEIFESDLSYNYLRTTFESCPFENSGFLKMCKFLGEKYKPEKIRIIMGFDS